MATAALAGRTPLAVATRRSDLAITQSAQTLVLLKERCGLDAVLVPMSSTGDDHPERALDSFDRKGIFLDSLREALLDGQVDLAIHSCKDVPTEPTPGLAITAIPPRADGRDVLVSVDGVSIDGLKPGAKVGTSSARRSAQLLALRPDIEIQPIRGNVPTRIGRIHKDLDAVILAHAGLTRLQQGRDGVANALEGLDFQAVPIPVAQMVPAPAQGILALEHREDDHALISALAPLNDAASARASAIERAVLAQLGGGCSIPLGVYAQIDLNGQANVHAFLGAGDTRPAKRIAATLDAQGDVYAFASSLVAQLENEEA